MLSEQTISCIIVDDEPLAQQLVEKFVKRLPFLKLDGVFDNAIEVISFLNHNSIDLIFLDINMPEMTGFELIKSFSGRKPFVIFTTAYAEYALEGFEHDAVDYLLKPFPFDRFVKAINKVKDRKYPLGISQNKTEIIETEATILPDFIWIKEDRKMVKIKFEDILYIEGMKDYLKIFMKDTMSITHMTMNHMEGLLIVSKKFTRINRSYIVNNESVIALDGNTIQLKNQKQLMIGSTFREQVKAMMKTK
jgi:two-component system, LytTR family, response regulator